MLLTCVQDDELIIASGVDPALVFANSASSFSTTQCDDAIPHLASSAIAEAQRLKHFPHAEVQANPSNFQVGYDDGFLIASDMLHESSPSSPSHRLKLNGWGQFRMSNFWDEQGELELNQLQLKRARLIFAGHSFTPDFSWLVSLDGRSQADGAVRLLDYYLNFDVGHHFLDWETRRLAIKLGQYKVPFTLARAVSAQELQFADRSVSSMFFDANRSLAFGIASELKQGDRTLAFETAVFNGLVTGGAETGTAGSIDNNFAFSSRLSAYLGGAWGQDDLCDYDQHQTPAFRLGGAFISSRIDREGTTEFDSIRVVDSGERLSSKLPAQVTEYLVNMYSLDASTKFRGWSFTSEYYFRHVGDFVGSSQQSLFDHGFDLQSGYFVIPKKMELLARWSRVMGDSGTLGLQEQRTNELASGAVWYYRRHAAKLTIDATYLDGSPIDSFSLDIREGMQGWLWRTQLQFGF